MLNKYRQRFTWGFVLLLIALGIIVNLVWPTVGIPLSAAGAAGLAVSAVIAFLAAFFIDLIDVPSGVNMKEVIRKLWPLAFSVLLMAALVTPLLSWLRAFIGV